MSWRSNQEGYDEETCSLNEITRQPGSSSEFNLKIGDPSLLDTIRAAGDLFTDALNSSRVQRTSQFCQDSCRPRCAESCWSPFLWCFDCFCTCVITPEDQIGSDEKHSDLAEFIQTQREEFGPICVGMAMKQGPWDIVKLLADGLTLTDEQKADFTTQCQEAKALLDKCIKGVLPHELFVTASASEHLPSSGSTEMEHVKRSLEESIAKTELPSIPTCLVLYPNKEGASSLNEQRSGHSLDFRRLQQQLGQMEVLDLDTEEISPLGFEAKTVVTIFQHTLNQYVNDAKHLFNSPGLGVTIEESKYRVLLLLSLLSLGFSPVGADQEFPTCLEQLKNTSQELRAREERSSKAPRIDLKGMGIGTEVRVNAGIAQAGSHHNKRIALNGRCAASAGMPCVDGGITTSRTLGNLWDPTSPKAQVALLEVAKTVNATTSSLFLR
ncbi:hypothetical protein [Chlamydia vaughanii]|uniref:hypothetical protein n=1 Tax=Chlamydia vaughanii TaxID=3112552 RepID=UPI0032B25ACD